MQREVPGWDERRVADIERRVDALDESKLAVEDFRREMGHLESRMDRHGRDVADARAATSANAISLASAHTKLDALLDDNTWFRRAVLGLLFSIVVAVIVTAIVTKGIG